MPTNARQRFERDSFRCGLGSSASQMLRIIECNVWTFNSETGRQMAKTQTNPSQLFCIFFCFLFFCQIMKDRKMRHVHCSVNQSVYAQTVKLSLFDRDKRSKVLKEAVLLLLLLLLLFQKVMLQLNHQYIENRISLNLNERRSCAALKGSPSQVFGPFF